MEKILIVDFGSRFTANVEESLKNRKIDYVKYSYKDLKEDAKDYSGIILTGSPCSVLQENYPSITMEMMESKTPILGICYGMQLIARMYGKKVGPAEKGEQGLFEIEFFDSVLFKGITSKNYVEMRHVHRVFELPEGFKLTGKTLDCPIAGMENTEKNIYATQFHPEIGGCGDKVLDNFLFNICKIDRK